MPMFHDKVCMGIDMSRECPFPSAGMCFRSMSVVSTSSPEPDFEESGTHTPGLGIVWGFGRNQRCRKRSGFSYDRLELQNDLETTGEIYLSRCIYDLNVDRYHQNRMRINLGKQPTLSGLKRYVKTHHEYHWLHRGRIFPVIALSLADRWQY